MERFNRTLGEHIAIAVKSNHREWDEALPYITSLYNKSVHSVTKETPHYLLYGQDPIEPDDISAKLYQAKEASPEHYNFINNWNKALNQAKNNINKSATKNAKRNYDQHTKQSSIKIGSSILF